MNVLNHEIEKIAVYVRPDQDRKMEKLKFKAKIDKRATINKSEIVRLALDVLFNNKDHDKLIEEITEIKKENLN